MFFGTDFMKLYEELSGINEDSISIEGVSSPEELMDWMNENITYELVDDEYSNSNGIPTKTAKEVLETGTGHCAEQSYLEKEVLDNLGYETFLVMVKENNSKKEYGAEGSAHVFLVYKEGKNYCWFEHSMQHAGGIHKYTSLEALLQDVANQWWRYDKNSDILEVRMMDKFITGVDTWGLAKECYKLPVEYTFDISNNIMESDVPLEENLKLASEQETIPYRLNKKFSADQVDAWVQQRYGSTSPGEGSIYITPNGTFINAGNDHAYIVYSLAENNFIKKTKDYKSFADEDGYVFVDGEVLAILLGYVRCNTCIGDWAYISLPNKTITSAQGRSLTEWLDTYIYTNKALKSIDVNTDNCSHTYSLIEYTSDEIVQRIKRYYASGRLYESLAQIDYIPVSDVELFKEYADDILGGYGDMSNADIKSSIKEIKFEGRLAGYIGFSEYEENGSKCLGIGNFMIIERGKGLGSAVIQNIVEKYKNQYDLIYCFVDAKNDGAIRLYKKLGKVYDEEGPNDNGEYYVTFWDNGKWKLNEEFDDYK